jgi:hypothetical protein
MRAYLQRDGLEQDAGTQHQAFRMTEADIVFRTTRISDWLRETRIPGCLRHRVGGFLREIDLHIAIFTDNNIIEVGEINFRLLTTFPRLTGIALVR